MGMTIAIAFDPNKYEGKLFMPRRKLVTFPPCRRAAPGQLITFLHALPPMSKYPPEADNTYWWVDCQFLPFRDNELCCSVGAYRDRPGRTPISVSPFVRGLVYTIKFTNKLSCSVIKGTGSTAMPKVTPHPEGSRICFVSTSAITLMDLNTLQCLVRNKDIRNSNFRFTAISPNGLHIAALARVSLDFELCILVIDSTFLLMTERYEMHLICPGFKGTRQYTEEVECKFSPDSRSVAISSSMGYLLVVSRKTNQQHTVVIGGKGERMFDVNQIRLSTERSYDFDPRYLRKVLAFGGTDNKVYICDILSRTVMSEINMGEEDIDCLQYCVRGPVLAVATREAKVRLFHPDSSELLYSIDAAAQGPEASMKATVNGIYPTIIRLSFSTSGEQMAMASTDGLIRLWQLYPDLSLQHICRKTILQSVNCSDLQRLPLPTRLILYLLEWPTL